MDDSEPGCCGLKIRFLLQDKIEDKQPYLEVMEFKLPPTSNHLRVPEEVRQSSESKVIKSAKSMICAGEVCRRICVYLVCNVHAPLSTESVGLVEKLRNVHAHRSTEFLRLAKMSMTQLVPELRLATYRLVVDFVHVMSTKNVRARKKTTS